MISRRILVNLLVFTIASTVLIGYGLVNLLGDPLRSATTLYATFPNASGLRTNFAVTLNGVEVGSVGTMKLVNGGVRVAIVIQPGKRIPSDVRASIDWANDLGEQQIDLTPAPQISGTGRHQVRITTGHRSNVSPHGGYVTNDQEIPVAPGGAPVQVAEVVKAADRFLSAIPEGDLNSFLQQLSRALSGRAVDLREIINSSTSLSKDFVKYQSQFEALLDSAPPILNGIASVGPQLTGALANTAVLTRLIAARRFDLVKLMRDGASAATIVDQLVGPEKANLACLIHDFSQVTSNLAQPANLGNLASGLQTSQWFFGAIDAVSPTGTVDPLYKGDSGSSSQEWLRTHLYLPPRQPEPSSYSVPHSIPPTRPGAACVSSEFGSGVGPAAQVGGQSPVPGASLSQPTAFDAQVSGKGG